jgi:hypothetical protein
MYAPTKPRGPDFTPRLETYLAHLQNASCLIRELARPPVETGGRPAQRAGAYHTMAMVLAGTWIGVDPRAVQTAKPEA